MTGLSNDNVRAEMRAYLQDENSSNELLLQKMQIAQYNESERVQKIKTTHRSTLRKGLNVIEQDGDLNDTCITPAPAKPSKPVKENSLFSKIEAINTVIRELTGQVASLVQTVQCDKKSD